MVSLFLHSVGMPLLTKLMFTLKISVETLLESLKQFNHDTLVVTTGKGLLKEGECNLVANYIEATGIHFTYICNYCTF